MGRSYNRVYHGYLLHHCILDTSNSSAFQEDETIVAFRRLDCFQGFRLCSHVHRKSVLDRRFPYTVLLHGFVSSLISLNMILTCIIEVFANYYGVNPAIAKNLVTISNAAGFFGRISSGMLGDKFGK